MTPNNEMPQEYFDHAVSIETFKQALIDATATRDPIPFEVCLAAFDSLAFCFETWQQIATAADGCIDRLRVANADLAGLLMKATPHVSGVHGGTA